METYLDVFRDEIACKSGLLLMIVCARLTSDLDSKGADGTFVNELFDGVGRTEGLLEGGAAE